MTAASVMNGTAQWLSRIESLTTNLCCVINLVLSVDHSSLNVFTQYFASIYSYTQ